MVRGHWLCAWLLPALAAALLGSGPARAGDAAPGGIQNPDFETGDLRGWTADPNWTVDNNAAGGWYSGWQGRWYAWSGRGGEAATGKLRSAPFVLDGDGVEVWVAGWADIRGRTADRWNYVTLNLADGREIDRVYAPNTTVFTPLVLDGGGRQGQRVYLEAVDNGTEGTFSMLCIDSVRTVRLPAVAAARFDPRNALVLENRSYRVEVSRRNGAIRRVRDKVGNLELIQEPRLADNFRFTLPLRGREAWQATEGNYISGRAQRLRSFRRTADVLELNWGPALRSDLGRSYPVSATMRIALTGDGVRFGLTIRNRSRQEIGEVTYPILGGVTGLGTRISDRQQTELLVPRGTETLSARIFHTFQNMSWLGVIGAEQFYAYPDTASMPWLELYSRRLDRGVYLGAHDPVARYKVLHLEMLPGVAGPRATGNWPRPEELHGLPAGVRASIAHIVYQPAGRTFEAAPVLLAFHRGGWRAAASIYGRWLQTRLGLSAAPRDWLHAVQTVGECRGVPFRDLPARAEAALARGARALLVRDWQSGGADSGLVHLAPDPRLGTPDALRDALARCRALGVRVILAARNAPVSMTSAAYRRELHRYAFTDRWGVVASTLGWQSGTSLSEIIGSGERRAWLDPGSPGYRALVVRQVARLAALGADGVHLEGLFPRPMDFNPALAATPDRAAWEGALECLAAVQREARRISPGFCVSVEETRDRLLPYATIVPAAGPPDGPFGAAFRWWRPVVVLDGNG